MNLMRPVTVLSVVLASSISFAVPNHRAATRVVQNNLPVMFQPVFTQTDQRAIMFGRVAGATVGFQRSGVVIGFEGKDAGNLQINFEGGRNSVPAGTDPQQSQTNYLLGNDPAGWRTHVPNYRSVTYSRLYPGIDTVFYGNGQKLEHDFVISPGADYRKIRMHFSRNSHISLSKDGALSIAVGGQVLQMQKPVIYQYVSGKKRQKSGSFRVLSDGDVGFRITGYDTRRTLVIDPVLSFATYLSPFGADANLIATDANGNNYVSGYGSLGFPLTVGAFAGCATCTKNAVVTFVSKISPDGTTLIYSTVLGGNGFAQPTGIAVDSNGNALVSGWTGASDFPTKSGQPYVPVLNNTVGFLVSLSPDGSSLNYGTRLGSTSTYAAAVAVDPNGNAYVTGDTGFGFLTSPGALNQGNKGNSDGFNVFLVKLNPAGVLIYSAVLGTADPQNGGGGPIGASAITVDAAGDAFVAGQAGILWPISTNAYLKQVAGPQPYATPFVTKVAPDAKSLIYSTYLDYAYKVNGIVALPGGDVFVAGDGVGPGYPTTPNAFEQNSGGGAAFLTELNSSGSGLVYSTTIGDPSYFLNGLALDPDGDIWIAAESSDPRSPLVTPLQSVYPLPLGPRAPVSLVNQFDPTGETLKFSTFLGGTAGGFANSIAIDPNHRAHVAGAAVYGMYTTPGAFAKSVPVPVPGFTEATYAYVALIDTSVPAPGLCVKPNEEMLFSAAIGGFQDQTLTLTDCGTQPLTITGVTSGASVFTVPTSENNCTQSIPVGQSCTLGVRYMPAVVGNDVSTLSIQSNASISVAVLSLNGSGQMKLPAVTLSPTSLSFPPQVTGTASSSQVLTLTNPDNLDFNISGMGFDFSGAASFSQTDNCGTVVSAGKSCTINVVFTPLSTGTIVGRLVVLGKEGQVTDFLPVNLLGTSPQAPFAVTPQAGGSASSTVAAGQPATYALSITPANGYSNTVTLTCSNLPVNASCSFSAASIVLGAGNPVNFTATIATKIPQSGMLLRSMSLALPLAAFLLVLPFSEKRSRVLNLIGIALLLFAVATGVSACGGGSSSPGGTVTPQPMMVARGTYSVQVVASDGTSKQTQSLTLVVQ